MAQYVGSSNYDPGAENGGDMTPAITWTLIILVKAGWSGGQFEVHIPRFQSAEACVAAGKEHRLYAVSAIPMLMSVRCKQVGE